jgi:cytosine/adenosine deaminase-related metal-dependent hydrolase
MRRFFASTLALFASLSPLRAQQPADLVLTNGTVVTMNDQKDVIENGVVVIRDAKLVAVGPASIAANYTAKKTIDARGGIVMPGFINTHTHAAMTIFRSLGDDVADRLKRFMFPLEAKFVDREVVYWGTLHGALEMVEGGVTTFVDMYYFEDEVARAAKKIGIRGVLGETILNFPAPDSKEPYGGFALAQKFVADFRGDPLITPAFAPHAPYTLDAAHLKLIAEETAKLDVPVLMHVAEMTDEVDTLRKERNQTPIEFLDSVGLLNRRLVAAHCIFVNDSDIALMKSRDIGIAHNMVANIKSAKGVSPALKMFEQGMRVGLGTDGPMSGNTLDIIGQLGYVAKLHKLVNHDRTLAPSVEVVEMATRGGARALHREADLGSLEAGKLADVIIIDADATNLIPNYDVYATLVYGASAKDVRTTIINGRVVMEDRKVLTLDAAEVKAHMRAMAAKISAQVGPVPK